METINLLCYIGIGVIILQLITIIALIKTIHFRNLKIRFLKATANMAAETLRQGDNSEAANIIINEIEFSDKLL